MKYLEWNHIIGEYFFNPSKAGREVLLYVTKKEISELGINKFGISSESESWSDYCKSIKTEFPEIRSKTNFIDKFIIVANKWKYYEDKIFNLNHKSDFKIENISIYSPDLEIVYPFYLGYLVALIIPLTDNVNTYRANVFFPPLNDFLITNNIVTSTSRTTTIAGIDWVWSNLEKWSKEYLKTDLGIFQERHWGNPDWRYVGKPFSQCLLSPKNIRDIPNLFWAADIAPYSLITEKHFYRIINLYGETKAGFPKRIKSIISDESNPLKKVVLDIVKREYSNWKGYVIEYGEDESILIPKSGWIYGTLLSAFKLNREDEVFSHYYYLYSQNDYPEELLLGGVEIMHTGNGYSSPISIDFDQSLNLTDDLNKWRASSTQNEITLYTSGSYFGLPSNTFVETDKVSRQSTMYLICKDSKKQLIEDWGNTFLRGDFKQINYENIPSGYSLYKFKNPQTSHQSEELLQIPTKKRVEFQGGIKVGNREYLKNLPPKIYINGATGNEKIFLEYIDSKTKIFLDKSIVVPEEYVFPTDIVYNELFLIRDEIEKLYDAELPYQITDIEFNPLDIINENLTKRNRYGDICEDNELEYVTGSNTTYNQWQMQLSWIFPFFSSIYNPINFIPNKIDYALQDGNFILQILSNKRNLKLQEFSEILDSIENISRAWESSIFQQNPKYIKQTSISFYDYLGFLDYDYSLNKISINRPQFIIIPSTNSLKAILIGGRSKSFVDALVIQCNIHEVNVELIPQSSQLIVYYLPDLIRLTPANCKNSSEAWKKLQLLGNELDIEFKITNKPYLQPQIIQFGLQDFSETITGYKENILKNKTIDRPNYEWARKSFDTDIYRFTKDSKNVDKILSLQEYYIQYRYFYILWLNNKSYEVDRNWGKFLILSERNKNIIFYNEKTMELAIPKYIQLPRLIAESIMLLSGLAPYYKNVRLNNVELTYQFYQNVPKLFAENLFKKFNQSIQIKNDL